MSRYTKIFVPAVMAILLLGTIGVFATARAVHAQSHPIRQSHPIQRKALSASTATPNRACSYWSASAGQNPSTSQNQRQPQCVGSGLVFITQ
jgi:hypothetical protein